MNSKQRINSGIIYDSNSKPQIIFYVKKYEDFIDAFVKYYEKLKTDTVGPTNFGIALTNVNSRLINDMRTRTTPLFL